MDYQQLLAELQEERSKIDYMIEWVKSRIQQSGAPVADVVPIQSQTDAPAQPLRFPRLASDTFFRMSVPQAIKTFLNIVKRPQKAKAITQALDTGGLTHQAKDLYATVYPTLLRMEKSQEVVRIGDGEWGLAEWYPGGGRKTNTNQEEKSENAS